VTYVVCNYLSRLPSQVSLQPSYFQKSLDRLEQKTECFGLASIIRSHPGLGRYGLVLSFYKLLYMQLN